MEVESKRPAGGEGQCPGNFTLEKRVGLEYGDSLMFFKDVLVPS